MKKTLYILLTLTLICCKGENKSKEDKPQVDQESHNVFKNAEKSRVVITLDGMDYHSPVKCSYFGEDHFYFKSDDLETTDTNGDGIVINGHQQDKKMVLTLIVEGKTYSAANLGLQKREFTAMGAGKLFAEDGTESFKTTYKVSCQ